MSSSSSSLATARRTLVRGLVLFASFANVLAVLNCDRNAPVDPDDRPDGLVYGCDSFSGIFAVSLRSNMPPTVGDSSSPVSPVYDAGFGFFDASTSFELAPYTAPGPRRLLLTIGPSSGRVSSMRGATISMSEARPPRGVMFIEGRTGESQVDIEVDALEEEVATATFVDLTMNDVHCVGYSGKAAQLNTTIEVHLVGRTVVGIVATIAGGQSEQLMFSRY